MELFEASLSLHRTVALQIGAIKLRDGIASFVRRRFRKVIVRFDFLSIFVPPDSPAARRLGTRVERQCMHHKFTIQ